MHARIAAALAVALVVSPVVALAAGFDYPDNGARALGMGAAHGAMPDDGTAIYYNPAALGAMEGAVLTLDNGLTSNDVSFKRTDANGAAIGQTTVTNTGGLFYAPFVSYAHNLFGHLTVAIGAYGPPADGRYAYPDPKNSNPHSSGQIKNDAPQRYMLVNNDIFVVYPTLSAGYRLFDRLYIGASLQLVHGTFDFEQYAWVDEGLSGKMDENPQQDLRLHVKTDSGWSQVTGILGLAVALPAGFALGASYRPHFDIVSKGTIETTPEFPSTMPLSQSGNKVQLTVPFPDVMRFGLDWRGGQLHAAADLVYETWGRVDHFTLTPLETIAFKLGTLDAGTLATTNIDRKWQNSMSGRLGVEYAFDVGMLEVTPRVGALYETSAIPENRTDIGFANWQRYMATAGVTVAHKGYGLTVGYGHVFQPDLQVRDSAVTGAAFGSDPNNPPKPSVIGNGDFSSSYNLLSIGLRVDFKNL